MNKNLLSIIFFLIFICCKGMSNNQIENSDQIIVYGTAACGLCTELKSKLSAEGINFEFKDVSLDEEANDEMFSKLKKTKDFDGYAYYPVVDVKGKVLVRPDVKKIKKAMQ